MNLIPLVAGSALAAASLNAQSARPIATYPFVLEDDHVVIDASINGRPGRFVLDSGSGAAAIASSFAEGLNLNLSETPATTSGAGRSATQARMGRASEVTIGPLVLANVRVVVLSNNPFKGLGRALDGTLGYEVFAKWTVTIDFANKTLTFFEPSTWVPSDSGVNITVDVSKRIPFAAVEIKAAPDAAPVIAKVMVDTGTPTFPFVLSSGFAARAGLDHIEARREAVLGFGTNGIVMGDILRVPEASFHGLLLRDAVVGISKDKTGFFASGIADGTVGQALFRRGRLTLDYAHNRISFEPGKNFDDPWAYPDHCGWVLGKDSGGDWTLLHVGEGTPAEEAGLAVGDKLIELDGQLLAPLNREQLREICIGEGLLSGKSVRRAERRQFELKRRKLI